jgi:hypothetical protein
MLVNNQWVFSSENEDIFLSMGLVISFVAYAARGKAYTGSS